MLEFWVDYNFNFGKLKINKLIIVPKYQTESQNE